MSGHFSLYASRWAHYLRTIEAITRPPRRGECRDDDGCPIQDIEQEVWEPVDPPRTKNTGWPYGGCTVEDCDKLGGRRVTTDYPLCEKHYSRWLRARHEPRLSDTELVAVRELIEDRFGDQTTQ